MRFFLRLGEELFNWLFVLCFAAPGRLGQGVRLVWARIFLGQFGKGARFARGCILLKPKWIYLGAGSSVGARCFFAADGGVIRIGDNVRFNINCHINASVGGEIHIGDNSLIGPNVVMRTASHQFDDPKQKICDQGHKSADIIIGEDVWIAANVVILPGVSIGHGAVIGAGSVVTKSVEPYSINAGVPARHIGMRDNT